MSVTHKVSLVAIIVLATTAASTSNASAQSVEVFNESSGSHCTPGCSTHATGELQLRGHVFGIEATQSDCNFELDRTLNEDGDGSTDATMTDHTGVNDCTMLPCEKPWLDIVVEESGGLVWYWEPCFESAPGQQHVRLLFITNILPETGSHGSGYSLEYGDTAGVAHTAPANTELLGQLTFETSGPTDTDFEVRHTP